jgi:hypothetical protein
MSAQIINLGLESWSGEISQLDLPLKTKSIILRAVRAWLSKSRYQKASYPQVDPEHYEEIVTHDICGIRLNDIALKPHLVTVANRRYFCLERGRLP